MDPDLATAWPKEYMVPRGRAGNPDQYGTARGMAHGKPHGHSLLPRHWPFFLSSLATWTIEFYKDPNCGRITEPTWF